MSFYGPEPELLSNLSIVLLMRASLPSWKEWYETKLPNCVVIASLLSCYLFSLCWISRLKYYLVERWRSKQSQAHIISNKLLPRKCSCHSECNSICVFSCYCCDHLLPYSHTLQLVNGRKTWTMCAQCSASKRATSNCVGWRPSRHWLLLRDYCAVAHNLGQLVIVLVDNSVGPFFSETWCNCRCTSLSINYKIIWTHFECISCRLLLEVAEWAVKRLWKEPEKIEYNFLIHKLSVRR